MISGIWRTGEATMYISRIRFYAEVYKNQEDCGLCPVQGRRILSPHLVQWSGPSGPISTWPGAVSDAQYLEYPFDPPVWTVDRRDYILREEDRVLIDKDGYMHAPQKPGLGFEPDEEALREYEVKEYYVGE